MNISHIILLYFISLVTIKSILEPNLFFDFLFVHAIYKFFVTDELKNQHLEFSDRILITEKERV